MNSSVSRFLSEEVYSFNNSSIASLCVIFIIVFRWIIYANSEICCYFFYDYSFYSRVLLFVIIIIVFLISREIDNSENDDYEYQRNGVPKAVGGRS